ncbi:MAG: ABC transporter ATP-binding protein [Clostridia bacterium]|nr:ABC transporter ATP-binding protein [Clostridia bacterium]
MDILRVENLSMEFGRRRVLDGLSFQVPEHSVFGFVGPNGAGKTTTMKLVLGLLKPVSGTITACGDPVVYGRSRTSRRIGYLPDVPEFYGYMTPREYLGLCGRISGLDAATVRDRSARLLSMVGLEKADKRIGGFSRGMKQRLGIAQALLHEPALLLCDEPTSALDPVGRKEILDILAEVRSRTTVVFSTHVLSDVERICDHVAILNNGRLAMSGVLSEIKEKHQQDGLLVEFADERDRDRLAAAARIAPYRTAPGPVPGALIVHARDLDRAESSVIEALAELRLLPVKMERLEPTLENLFLEAVQ